MQLKMYQTIVNSIIKKWRHLWRFVSNDRRKYQLRTVETCIIISQYVVQE